MKPIRFALVGCGKVGQLHARAIRQIPGAELAGVCDADPPRAEKFARQFGGQPFSSVPELLQGAQPGALTVCTPHPQHAGAAIQAAQAGVHVFVEKPLAASLADCDRILEAAHNHRVKLGVVSQRRFFEPVQRMKTAIDTGKIGQPALAVFMMFSWRDEAYYRSDPWRGQWKGEGGGVLVNQSPHQLDLLRWFMGDVAEVSGFWANLNHPSVEVDDTAVATLRFKNGGLGSIVTSVSQKPGLFTKVHVHGTNGSSVGVETDRGATFIAGVTPISEPPLNDLWTIPGEESLLATFREQDQQHFQSIDATLHYHQKQIEDFADAIRHDRPPLVTGEDGRAVVEIFNAIYESNRTGRTVRLPLLPP